MSNRKLLICWIQEAIDKKISVFPYLMSHIQLYYEKPCHTISDFKERRTKKQEGDIFEEFCCLYLENKGYTAWLLKDIPDNILKELQLTRKDMGIDIVAKKDDKYYAIQSKFKKKFAEKRYNVLGWKQISTFCALCSRTGPWEQCIIMTTADYAKRIGTKKKTDITIAYKTFVGMDFDEWKNIISHNTSGKNDSEKITDLDREKPQEINYNIDIEKDIIDKVMKESLKEYEDDDKDNTTDDLFEKDLEKNIANAIEHDYQENRELSTNKNISVDDQNIKKEIEILKPVVQLSEKEIELKKIRDARIAHFSKLLNN